MAHGVSKQSRTVTESIASGPGSAPPAGGGMGGGKVGCTDAVARTCASAARLAPSRRAASACSARRAALIMVKQERGRTHEMRLSAHFRDAAS